MDRKQTAKVAIGSADSEQQKPPMRVFLDLNKIQAEVRCFGNNGSVIYTDEPVTSLEIAAYVDTVPINLDTIAEALDGYPYAELLMGEIERRVYALAIADLVAKGSAR